MNSNYKYICPKEECTGCMACNNGCAHSAIEIIKDSLGFRYPVIYKSKCTNCGLCFRVCPQLNHRQFIYPQKCYAAVSKNEKDQLTCASGGIATVLGRYVIKNGGVVVGCSGKNINNVHHKIIESLDDIEELRGSKYVQSRISETLFRDIRQILISGRKVLFIGTGCQVAGLRNFLIKDYSNLITVDLVCHGVSSQQLLDEGLAYYKSKNLKDINFRKKFKHKSEKDSEGSKYIKYGISALQEPEGSQSYKEFWRPYYKDYYLGSFMSCVSLREGCYECLYSRPERQSDITICDFWGLSKNSKLYSMTGVSAMLINTTKGTDTFSQIYGELDIEEREIEEAVKGNGRLKNPSPHNKYRSKYIEIYRKYGIKKAYSKTVYPGLLKQYYKTLIRPLLYPIYSIIKPLLHK